MFETRGDCKTLGEIALCSFVRGIGKEKSDGNARGKFAFFGRIADVARV